jgi:hypothetical protein
MDRFESHLEYYLMFPFTIVSSAAVMFSEEENHCKGTEDKVLSTEIHNFFVIINISVALTLFYVIILVRFRAFIYSAGCCN